MSTAQELANFYRRDQIISGAEQHAAPHQHQHQHHQHQQHQQHQHQQPTTSAHPSTVDLYTKSPPTGNPASPPTYVAVPPAHMPATLGRAAAGSTPPPPQQPHHQSSPSPPPPPSQSPSVPRADSSSVSDHHHHHHQYHQDPATAGAAPAPTLLQSLTPAQKASIRRAHRPAPHQIDTPQHFKRPTTDGSDVSQPQPQQQQQPAAAGGGAFTSQVAATTENELGRANVGSPSSPLDHTVTPAQQQQQQHTFQHQNHQQNIKSNDAAAAATAIAAQQQANVPTDANVGAASSVAALGSSQVPPRHHGLPPLGAALTSGVFGTQAQDMVDNAQSPVVASSNVAASGDGADLDFGREPSLAIDPENMQAPPLLRDAPQPSAEVMKILQASTQQSESPLSPEMIESPVAPTLSAKPITDILAGNTPRSSPTNNNKSKFADATNQQEYQHQNNHDINNSAQQQQQQQHPSQQKSVSPPIPPIPLNTLQQPSAYAGGQQYQQQQQQQHQHEESPNPQLHHHHRYQQQPQEQPPHQHTPITAGMAISPSMQVNARAELARKDKLQKAMEAAMGYAPSSGSATPSAHSEARGATPNQLHDGQVGATKLKPEHFASSSSAAAAQQQQQQQQQPQPQNFRHDFVSTQPDLSAAAPQPQNQPNQGGVAAGGQQNHDASQQQQQQSNTNNVGYYHHAIGMLPPGGNTAAGGAQQQQQQQGKSPSAAQSQNQSRRQSQLGEALQNIQATLGVSRTGSQQQQQQQSHQQEVPKMTTQLSASPSSLSQQHYQQQQQQQQQDRRSSSVQQQQHQQQQQQQYQQQNPLTGMSESEVDQRVAADLSSFSNEHEHSSPGRLIRRLHESERQRLNLIREVQQLKEDLREAAASASKTGGGVAAAFQQQQIRRENRERNETFDPNSINENVIVRVRSTDAAEGEGAQWAAEIDEEDQARTRAQQVMTELLRAMDARKAAELRLQSVNIENERLRQQSRTAQEREQTLHKMLAQYQEAFQSWRATWADKNAADMDGGAESSSGGGGSSGVALGKSSGLSNVRVSILESRVEALTKENERLRSEMNVAAARRKAEEDAEASRAALRGGGSAASMLNVTTTKGAAALRRRGADQDTDLLVRMFEMQRSNEQLQRTVNEMKLQKRGA